MQGALLEPGGQSGHFVANELNQRFANGRPADHFEEAGVVMHTLDGWEDAAHPWRTDPLKHKSFSASVVNAIHPDIYSSIGGTDQFFSNRWLQDGFAGLVYKITRDSVSNAMALTPVDAAGLSFATAKSGRCTKRKGCVVQRALKPSWIPHNRTLRNCIEFRNIGVIPIMHWACYYDPSELRIMMQQQTLLLGGRVGPIAHPARGRVPFKLYSDPGANDFSNMWEGYNELILKSSDALKPLVQAIFVRGPDMCTQNCPAFSLCRVRCGAGWSDLRLAWSVQKKLRADGIDVPILTYNRSSATAPFAVLGQMDESYV